jgi:hypothetical protein
MAFQQLICSVSLGVFLTPFLTMAMAGAYTIPFSGTYTLPNPNNGTAPTSAPYNGTAIPNLTAGDITRTGLTAQTTASPAFRSGNFPLCTPVTCLTGSYDVGKYLAFTLTAASGTTLNLSRLEFDLQRSATGPRSFAWATSVDNYTTFSDNYTQLGTGLSSTSYGTGFQAGSLYFTADSSQTITGNVLNLSAASYQGLSSISFRLYGWNAEGSSGTGGLQNSLSFSGSLNAPDSLPAPLPILGALAGFRCSRRLRKRLREAALRSPA